MEGWAGKRIRVDLTSGKIAVEALPLDHLKKWIGARGLNSEVVFRESSQGMDPFSPDNPLCFGVGPLSGTFAPSSGRVTVSARSPMTTPHGHGDTNMGGHWGPELKYAGYDQIVLKGKADKPTYLWINDDNIELRDASHLWGKDSMATTLALTEELGDPNVMITCIGPAGEKLVRYACVINTFNRAGGRTGMGAVMGSKNLKAIAVRGSKAVRIARPKEFFEKCKETRVRIDSDPAVKMMQAEGTMLLFDMANGIGLAGAYKNHTTGFAPGIEEEFGGVVHMKKYLHSREGCFACPISCGRYTYIKEGPFAGTHFGGPEMESACNLGPRCGTYDWQPVMKMVQNCDLYGLDTISTGAAMSWAMDCYENGLLTEADTGGIPFVWGDTDTMLKVIDMICNREGFGDLLAEGALRAAWKIGRETEKLVPHCRGLEHISCDPRIVTGFSLGYAVSTRGSDHLKNMSCLEFPPAVGLYQDLIEKVLGDQAKDFLEAQPNNLIHIETKPKLCKWSEEDKCIADMVGMCCFPNAWWYPLRPEDLTKLFNLATGMNITADEMMRISARVVNIERATWNREGSGRNQDVHIDRYYELPVQDGPYKGAVLDRKKWEKAIDEYYRLHRWDKETGFPSNEVLKELGLDFVAEQLEKARKEYLKKKK